MPLTWTSEKPQQAGWYWLKWLLGIPVVVYLVSLNGEMYVSLVPGELEDFKQMDLEQAMWAGPIPMPEEA